MSPPKTAGMEPTKIAARSPLTDKSARAQKKKNRARLKIQAVRESSPHGATYPHTIWYFLHRFQSILHKSGQFFDERARKWHFLRIEIHSGTAENWNEERYGTNPDSPI